MRLLAQRQQLLFATRPTEDASSARPGEQAELLDSSATREVTSVTPAREHCCAVNLSRLATSERSHRTRNAMSMKLVKQLRQATGARLVDCKAAVEATTGLEEAFQWLREKGASRAAKLETRTAAHGLVAARAAAGRGCLVEVNSETDFVARNAEFQRFVRDLADAALRNYASLTAPQRDAGGAALVGGDALKALDLQGTLVTDAALALSAHVGERIDVRRCALVEGALVSAYAHNGADGAGTAAGVVVACVLFFPSSVLTSFSAQVALDGGDDDVGRQLAMHCVAARPLAIDVDGLPPSLLDAERVILEAQLADSAKPADVVEKILKGKLNKFAQERALLTQVHVVDGKKPVQKVLKKATVDAFAVFSVGENIE